MGVKGPASLQYIDYSYLVNPEGAFYKGQQGELLLQFVAYQPKASTGMKFTSRKRRRVRLIDSTRLLPFPSVEGLMPPELSEVRVAMERWEAGIPARGMITRGGR